MKKTAIILSLGSVVALAFSAAAESTFLIARGKSANAAIVVPKGAGEATRYAAEELAKYLGKMSGATFRISEGKGGAARSIVVGEPCTSEREEEICLRVSKDGKTLTLTGEGPRGPLYAVYGLLERLGCEFWTPPIRERRDGVDFRASGRETVPELKEIVVPGNLNVVEAPAIAVRQAYGASAFENPEWEAKLRLNGTMYLSPLPEKLGGSRQYDLSQCKMGLETDAKAFAAHPEWYALRPGGKRSMQHLCNTNPGVRQELLRRVKEKLEKEPNIRQIAIGQNDGGEFCKCPACQKMREQENSQSGPELDLCNFVARHFAKDYPKVRFLVFAYEASLRPPKRMKCEPNVDVCVAYIQRNYARDPAAGTPNHNAIVGEWSKLTHGNVYIWGYCAQFKDFMITWPTVDTLGPEIRTYRDLGVKGVYMQMADDPHSDFQALRCWLAAKLMWNPDQDEMKLMERWCEGACGAGGKYVFEWLKVCKRVRESHKSLGVYSGDSRETFKPEEILKGDELLAKAEAATKNDPTAFAEVHRIRDNVTHMMLLRYYYDVAAAAKKAGCAIPTRAELLKTLAATGKGSWNEGIGWGWGFLPRIRHGEVQPEKPGDGPRTRGRWTFRNPMTTGTSEDPFVVYDEATKRYYRVMTVGDEFRIRRAKRMVELFDEKCEEKPLWKPGRKDVVNSNLRGPELVRGADGVWRVWACGGEASLALDGESADDAVVNRLFLLKGGKDPFADSFRFAGAVCPKEVASDPTVFKMPDGKTYLFYSRAQGKAGIVGRPLAAPDKPGAKDGVVLPAKNGSELGTSPALAKMGDDVYMLYVAGGRDSATSEIRALRYTGGDPLKERSWEKCQKPVMVSGNAFLNENVALFGPRAPATFRSSDGTEAWIAFRGWCRKSPIDKTKDAIMCVQRLDDGLDVNSLLFKTGAELRILLIQPSGDFALADGKAGKAK